MHPEVMGLLTGNQAILLQADMPLTTWQRFLGELDLISEITYMIQNFWIPKKLQYGGWIESTLLVLGQLGGKMGNIQDSFERDIRLVFSQAPQR